MRSFSRSSLILLTGGASWDNLISLASIFFSPVAASTYQSSPCSPASSRCTKDILVPSGLHLIVSGARPVTPPSAKICSIVSCFGAAVLGAAGFAHPPGNRDHQGEV